MSRPGPRRGTIGVKVSDEQRDGLEAVAAADEVSLSDVVRRAIDAELAKAARRRAKR